MDYMLEQHSSTNTTWDVEAEIARELQALSNSGSHSRSLTACSSSQQLQDNQAPDDSDEELGPLAALQAAMQAREQLAGRVTAALQELQQVSLQAHQQCHLAAAAVPDDAAGHPAFVAAAVAALQQITATEAKGASVRSAGDDGTAPVHEVAAHYKAAYVVWGCSPTQQQQPQKQDTVCGHSSPGSIGCAAQGGLQTCQLHAACSCSAQVEAPQVQLPGGADHGCCTSTAVAGAKPGQAAAAVAPPSPSIAEDCSQAADLALVPAEGSKGLTTASAGTAPAPASSNVVRHLQQHDATATRHATPARHRPDENLGVHTQEQVQEQAAAAGASAVIPSQPHTPDTQDKRQLAEAAGVEAQQQQQEQKQQQEPQVLVLEQPASWHHHASCCDDANSALCAEPDRQLQGGSSSEHLLANNGANKTHTSSRGLLPPAATTAAAVVAAAKAAAVAAEQARSRQHSQLQQLRERQVSECHWRAALQVYQGWSEPGCMLQTVRRI